MKTIIEMDIAMSHRVRAGLARSHRFALALALGGLAPTAFAQSIYVLTTTNGITRVDEADPGSAGTVLPVPLVAGDALVAIDVRPQNNRLYGLGYNGATSSVQLYLIEIRAGTAVATVIGPAGSFVDVIGSPVLIAGTAFDIDFDPTIDQLRVVTNTGQSFRMNPNSGAVIDGDFGLTVIGFNGINLDGSANSAGTKFDAAAYTNNRANVSATTLYTIDAASDRLFVVNPPNMGTLTSPKPLTLAGSSLDVSAESGFDIPSEIDVPTSNTSAGGFAYGAFTVGGVASLYKLNLADASATLVGSFGGLAVRDIAIASLPASAQSLNSSGTSLQRFLMRSPANSVSVNINGVAAGQRLVGFDLRPATGQWIALGVNAVANSANLYRVDPRTGTATMIGSGVGAIAFADGAGVAIDFPDGTYGASFDPTTDLLRVVASNGLNFRANPITGIGIDGDFGNTATPTPLTNPDGMINSVPTIAGADGAAHSGNFAGSTTTTLYTLVASGDRLLIQNPPTSGTQTLGLSVTSNGGAVDFSAANGFDIPPGPAAIASNLPVVGSGFAALTIGGTTSLFRIGLSDGALQEIGPIGSGATESAGLVTGENYIDSIFAHDFE